MHTTRTSVPGRAEKDATEDDDQCRGKNERVEGHFMFRVDLCKKATRRKSSVSETPISICNRDFLDGENLTYLAKA